MSPTSEKSRTYWRINLSVTIFLLTIWGLVTYVLPFHARGLNEITILGFPLGFYMAAQGAVVVYVVVVGFYAWFMNRLDRRIDGDH